MLKQERYTVFFDRSALKNKVSNYTVNPIKKSSICQNFVKVWHFDFFRADQSPCMYQMKLTFGRLDSELDLLDKSCAHEVCTMHDLQVRVGLV